MRHHSKSFHPLVAPRLFLLWLLIVQVIALPEANARAAPHRKASHHNPTPAQPHSRAANLRRVKHGNMAHASAQVFSRHRHHPLHTSSHTVKALIPPVARVAYVPALKGSRESLVRQNIISDAEGLDRIENDSQLEQMVASNDLVLLPSSPSVNGLQINNAMPMNRRYCRPWTAKFLVDLARVHAQRFRNALIVTSAVRTAEYQRHLLRTNGNAAPAEGDLASPHLTGATVDIAKKGLSMAEIGWLRAYLLPLQTSGKVDVEEEFRQSCFHITVYNGYLPPETIPAVPSGPSRRRTNRGVILAARLH